MERKKLKITLSLAVLIPCVLYIAGNEKDGFERGGLGSYRRIQKVDCIVTDTDYQVEDGEDEQENDNA